MRHRYRLLVTGLGLVALAVAMVLLAPWGQDPVAANGTVHYVDADATGANNGSSWADAFIELQPALDAAVSGDQIWVAAGIYKPTAEHGGTGDRYRSFQMVNGVAIYGGFAGTETELGQRDWVNNVTILSGDIGVGGDNSDNSYHVFYHPSELALDSTAALDGFTITGGNASGYPHNSGGGMYNDNSSPTLTNCTFSDNAAVSGTYGDGGGGMYNHGSSPVLTNCTFSGNWTSWYSTSGGGMLNVDSSPVLNRCTFEDNHADDMSLGGGMSNLEGSSPTLTDCTFKGNSTTYKGGGGGMFNGDSSPTLRNCTLWGNSAGSGGGMYNSRSSPTVTNCTFSSNSASSDGGAMHNYDSSATLTNCILRGDTPDEIGNDPDSTTVVTYSDIQGGYPGEGNMDLDPMFVNPGTGDFHLGLGSPCIDAGSNTATDLPPYDFEGDARILDGDRDGTAIVDMGVDEARYPLFVDVDATSGASNGSSWADAFTELQPALDAAVAGDEIWVAAGAYKPTAEHGGTGDRYRSFQLINGVALFGGFDPSVGDTAFEDRDWEANATVLSGDLNGDDGPDFENNDENSYHVFYHPDGTNLDSSAILDGFAISGGNANGASYPDTAGGAMFNYGSSPALINCTLEGNWASFGGAMWNQNASTTLAGCHFSGNAAGAAGGGIYNQDSAPTLIDCTVAGNSATYHGGGIFNNGSSPTLTNCTFSGNWSLDDGVGMTNGGGSSPLLINCTFWGNSASDTGGGMYNDGATSTLINCTFWGNTANTEGGGMWSHSGSTVLTNSILWGNSPDQISDLDSSWDITYSDVQGGHPGVTNIDENPLFADPANGDFHLGPDSPCIDVGNNDAPDLPDHDFEGHTRIVDGDGDGEPVVDMGVDEVLLRLYLPLVFRGY